MKSRDHADELKEAGRSISLLGGTVEAEKDYAIPGTDIVHSVICIRKTSVTPPKYPRRWAQIKKQPL